MSEISAGVDKLTASQLRDLLASLEVDVDKLLEFGPSILELKKRYRKMLAQQLREFREGDTCMNQTWQELR
jgi:hypothetical protein